MSRILKELGLILTFPEKERLMKDLILLFQYFKGWLKRDGRSLFTRSHMKTRCCRVQVALGEISSQ